MIDKALLQILRIEINAALEAVGAKHNVRLSAGSASFTEAEATFKLYAAAKTADGLVVDKDAAAFKARSLEFGLQPERLGQELELNGQKHEIIGLQPKRYRHPIVCRNVQNNRKFVFSADAVIYGLERRDANLLRLVADSTPHGNLLMPSAEHQTA